MNETECPACAGPDNAACATCNGTSIVTYDVFNAFIANQDLMRAQYQLRQALQELPIENVPGIEQKAIVITTVDNQIKAEIDSTPLVWNEQSQSWV